VRRHSGMSHRTGVILAAATRNPPAAVAELAKGIAVRGLSKKLVWVVFALVGNVALGVAARSSSFKSDTQLPAKTTPALPPVVVENLQPVQIPPDRDPETLPPGALVRLGTVQFRHSNWVNAVAFSVDGKRLASASWDRTIRIWDSATGKELRRFTGHSHAVLGLALSADGKTLASAGDTTIRIWEVESGRELFNVRAHEGSMVSCVALSPDGQTLASGGGGNGHRTLVLWSVASGKELHVLGDKQAAVTSVAFSPDGRLLAAGG